MARQYPINSQTQLTKFLSQQVPRVLSVGEKIGLRLEQPAFTPDHLGLQVLNGEEFNAAHKTLSKYCKLVHNEMIHGRRNRVYRFTKPASSAGISFPGIEIFEPKPDAKPSTLRPGIEHVAFVVGDLPRVQMQLERLGLIAKDATYSLGRFLKTKLIDGIEIEFREKPLV